MIYMPQISLWKYLANSKIPIVNWTFMIMSQIQPIHRIYH